MMVAHNDCATNGTSTNQFTAVSYSNTTPRSCSPNSCTIGEEEDDSQFDFEGISVHGTMASVCTNLIE